MRTDPQPCEVRELVARTFADLGAVIPALFDLDEALLIDGGKYVARSYRADGYMAMWLLEVGIVQFYDGAGNMLRTVNLVQELKPQKMAA